MVPNFLLPFFVFFMENYKELWVILGYISLAALTEVSWTRWNGLVCLLGFQAILLQRC